MVNMALQTRLFDLLGRRWKPRQRACIKGHQSSATPRRGIRHGLRPGVQMTGSKRVHEPLPKRSQPASRLPFASTKSRSCPTCMRRGVPAPCYQDTPNPRPRRTPSFPSRTQKVLKPSTLNSKPQTLNPQTLPTPPKYVKQFPFLRGLGLFLHGLGVEVDPKALKYPEAPKAQVSDLRRPAYAHFAVFRV